MNYAFHIDLGQMTYEEWHGLYTDPEGAKLRDGWWGPEHIAKSGPNSAVILAQVNDEERLTEHMKMVHKMAAERGMKHTMYKMLPV